MAGRGGGTRSRDREDAAFLVACRSVPGPVLLVVGQEDVGIGGSVRRIRRLRIGIRCALGFGVAGHRVADAGHHLLDVARQRRIGGIAREALLVESQRFLEAILRERGEAVDEMGQRVGIGKIEQRLPGQQAHRGATRAELDEAQLIARHGEFGGEPGGVREGGFGLGHVAQGGEFGTH